MGDLRQFKIVRNWFGDLEGAVLEVGSKNYGNTPDFRQLFQNSQYLGVDMIDGDGVDLVHDFTLGLGKVKKKSFSLVICCSVLEHSPKPWKMAENLCKAIKPGGYLYISVPWIFPFHGYPNDYFRFSPAGIKALFPSIEWSYSSAHSGPKGKFHKCEGDNFDKFCAVLAEDLDGKPERSWKKCIINMIGQSPAE